MAQPRNLKGQFVSDREGGEQSEHERLEKAKDYPTFRKLREPELPKPRSMSGKYYGYYSHYQM